MAAAPYGCCAASRSGWAAAFSTTQGFSSVALRCSVRPRLASGVRCEYGCTQVHGAVVNNCGFHCYTQLSMRWCPATYVYIH